MKNEGLPKVPHSSERVQSYEYSRHRPNVLQLFYLLINDLDEIYQSFFYLEKNKKSIFFS